ncbi:hypothetical protein QYF36_003061 [Acer negundo]|nr:hypothetical protein QYF36_003061 [Acer negundo]
MVTDTIHTKNYAKDTTEMGGKVRKAEEKGVEIRPLLMTEERKQKRSANVRKPKIRPSGFLVNKAKLVIGKSGRDVRRWDSTEESSWSSSEVESGEMVRKNFNRWEGDCSKGVRRDSLMELAHSKALPEGPMPEMP